MGDVSEQWTFPWEQAAQRGEDMPDGLGLPDQMAYAAMRSIYWDFHEKRMGRDRAGEEKQRLRRAWEQARESEAFERKLCAYHTRLIRCVERAACRCRKEPTAENALYLCDVLDGIERPEVDESGRSGQV